MSNQNIQRRNFLKFFGSTSALFLLVGVGSGVLTSCSNPLENTDFKTLGFKPLSPKTDDDLILADGLEYRVLLSWEDHLNAEEKFGFNNDFTSFYPLENKKDEGILWVNHEYVHPMFVSGYTSGEKRTKKQVDLERLEVGGSLVHIKKGENAWEVVEGSKYNRRLNATTKIPFVALRPIDGSSFAVGTLGNCAGGQTPWGTFLSAEENYQHYYGEFEHRSSDRLPGWLSWNEFYDQSPRHYGWVVEIAPLTGEAKKLTALGRISHESATFARAKDGRAVIYSGDDKAIEFIYKFISDSKDSLETGELFVANLKEGKWLSLDRSKSKVLQAEFDDQLDVLIHCRKAGRLLGATPCDRPEDIEINPRNGDVIVALTNNYDKKNWEDPKNNFYGSLLKISEKGEDSDSLVFTSETLVMGGRETGLACPDNLCFDRRANLWVTTDISGSVIEKKAYKGFGNNALHYIPMSGPYAGQVFQVASAPVDAELTGPTFAPDGETLFLSVQHPGEKSKSLKNLTSHWPNGGDKLPRSSVVQIQGKTMKRLLKV
jgi:hypothetical protein